MDITEFLKSAEAWASLDDNIRSLILVGSHARGEAREDSDVDLVIITENPDIYISDPSFTDRFYRKTKVEIEDWGMLTSVRTWFENGLEVEFGITTPEWCSRPLDKGTLRVLSDGYKVIADKEGYFKDIL